MKRERDHFLWVLILGCVSLIGLTARLWSQGKGPYGLVATPVMTGATVLDLANTGVGSRDLWLCRGDGEGNFSCANSIPLGPLGGSEPHAVIAAKFTSGQCTDLAVTDFGSHKVFIFLGTCSGYALPTPERILSVGRNPEALIAADFNNDRKLDLAVVSQGTNEVWVFLGDGLGHFGPPYIASVGGLKPSALAAGDFNGDDKLDLVVSNRDSDNVAVLLGNGDGTFRTPRSFNVDRNPQAVTVEDFDGDDCLDLATANSGASNVSVLLGQRGMDGQCDGTFGRRRDYGVVAQPQSIVAGAFHSDGDLDLVVTNFTANQISLLRGRGDGSFDPAINRAVGEGPKTLVAADFDNDNVLDLATANFGSNNLTILLGDGKGSFSRRDCRGETCVPK